MSAPDAKSQLESLQTELDALNEQRDALSQQAKALAKQMDELQAAAAAQAQVEAMGDTERAALAQALQPRGVRSGERVGRQPAR